MLAKEIIMEKAIEKFIKMAVMVLVSCGVYYASLYVLNELNYRDIINLCPAVEDVVLGYNYASLVKEMTIEVVKVVFVVGAVLQVLGVLWYIHTGKESTIERIIFSDAIVTGMSAWWVFSQYDVGGSYVTAVIMVIVPSVVITSSCFWFISEVVPEIKDVVKYVPKVKSVIVVFSTKVKEVLWQTV